MIYVASSWRNEYQQGVVKALRHAGHEVYDFKDPAGAFVWSDIDSDWMNWTPETYLSHLYDHREATRGFERDMGALRECDTVVLVLPAGPSAHLELGHGIGNGKTTYILLPPSVREWEPDLMYRAASRVVESLDYLLDILSYGEDFVEQWHARGGR